MNVNFLRKRHYISSISGLHTTSTLFVQPMPDFQTYHMSYFDETKTGLSNLSQLSFDLTKSSFQLNREYSFGAIFSGLKYQHHAI